MVIGWTYQQPVQTIQRIFAIFVYDSTKFCVNIGQLLHSDVTVWDLQCSMITHIAYGTQRVLQTFLHLNFFRGHFKQNVTAKLLLHLKPLHSRKFK